MRYAREVDRQQLEHELRAYFAELGDRIVAAYLFGSTARGEARPGSDVDVGLLYRSVPRDPLDALGTDIAAALAARLGCEVDVVVMNEAPVDLVHRILRDGILIAEHDRSSRIAFEVQARREYFDLLPVLRRYRRTEERAP
jgi:hypothetical protein